ncbi:MAG: hypothetical protein C4K49_05310 [Candidatus Thorarchaeota archaeon]|nr:MAG: hypothetical protein C4K49_05310 [Candidatus Thorarchaeota archaeon]
MFLILQDLIQQGYPGLLLACFVINMIPFLSPSNMVLAGLAALLVPTMYWVPIGFVVAISATLAKAIHYGVVRSSRMAMSDEHLRSLDQEKARVEKWGALALFIAAASPIPDDPLIVYVGLTRYNPLKFIVSYFIGKLTVTLAGAFLGYVTGGLFEGAPIVIASIALTAIITGILFKRRSERRPEESLGHEESAGPQDTT